MTAHEAIKGVLHIKNSPGLENRAFGCKCSIDNLAPCGEDPSLCTLQCVKDDNNNNIIQFPVGKRKR